MAKKFDNHLRNESENNQIISETQLKLLRTDSIEDLFNILTNSVHDLINDGVVASVHLSDTDNSMKFVTCTGLGDTLDKIIKALGLDPTKKSKPVDKMNEREFKIYRSGKLEKVEKGIYGLLASLVPRTVCDTVQKMMRIKEIFTIGLIQKDSPMGGLIILTRNDISAHFDTIEMIVSQAAFIIQRKRAEEALKESEERFKALHNASFGGIAIHDKGHILDCNLGLTEITGYSIKELIGMNGLLLIAPDYRDYVIEKIMSGYEKSYEACGLRKNGEIFPLRLEGRNIPYKGKVVRTVEFRDITEQKNAEQALRESEEKYRTLINCANEIITVIQDGTACHVNSMASSLTGYSEDELTSNPFETFVFPEDRPLIMERHQKRLKNEPVPDRYEFRLIMKDGSIRWVQNGAVQIEWNGHPATLNFLVDINDRKKAEKEVLKIVQHYKALIEKAPDGVVLIDSSGSFKFVSSSARKIFGYSTYEEIAGSPDELTHPDDLPMVLSELAKIFENPSYVPTLQYRFAHKTGDWIWIESTFSNLLADPSVESIVINFRDITDRKKIEEIIQRSAKLDSLGILAGGIAHDFNNLLAGIFGYIDLAKLKSSEPQVSEYLEKSLGAIERARGLTEQLLTFAKGGAPIKKPELLFPFLKETALFSLSGTNVSCNFNYPEDLWACDFDRNQIGQVVENLIINAQQAMPIGGTIEFSARNISLSEKEHPTLAGGNYVKISIKDSGIGIPKEFISRIFDPFFTTKPKGHGLGLSSCYSIINRHDGCIDVESESGTGSTFHVYIPASSESIASLSKNSNTEHTGSGTVLIMDDEEIISDIISAMLESFGYTVVCKTNGKDAVDFFTAENEAGRNIAAMIFDLTIPGGMGGKEAVKKIRKLNTEIPVFVASGYASDPIMANPAEHGFTASICKPFKITDLMKMLNTHLK